MLTELPELQLALLGLACPLWETGYPAALPNCGAVSKSTCSIRFLLAAALLGFRFQRPDNVPVDPQPRSSTLAQAKFDTASDATAAPFLTRTVTGCSADRCSHGNGAPGCLPGRNLSWKVARYQSTLLVHSHGTAGS